MFSINCRAYAARMLEFLIPNHVEVVKVSEWKQKGFFSSPSCEFKIEKNIKRRFCCFPLAKKLQTPIVITGKLRKTLLYNKAARKILVILTTDLLKIRKFPRFMINIFLFSKFAYIDDSNYLYSRTTTINYRSSNQED